MKALVVNDDGYKAAGIRALLHALKSHYDTVAVAPDREQSWKGKSITAHNQELKLSPITYHEFEGYHVNGTPADCTQLGIYETGAKPDFVVSGLNHGANIGHAHTISSGTVGAALEAALQSIPAFSSSVWHGKRGTEGADLNAPESAELFVTEADITRRIIDKVMAAGFPPQVQVIAINLPYGVDPDAQWVVTQPHTLSYGRLFTADGDIYKNVGSSELQGHEAPGTDLAALAEGYVSIVPLTIQLTTDAARQELAEILQIPLYGDNS